MIAKFFDKGFTCDETMQTYVYNVLNGCNKYQNIPDYLNVPNYIPSFIDLYVVLFPSQTQRAKLDCQAGSYKEISFGYTIPCLSCQLENCRLCIIYVGLTWLYEWLVSLMPFFKRQESVHRLFMVLYSRFASFEKLGKAGEQKGELSVQFLNQHRSIFETFKHDTRANPNVVIFTKNVQE